MVIEELDDLKASLGSETTSELEAKYLSAGGEQFLQDPNRLQCMYSFCDDRKSRLIPLFFLSSIKEGPLSSTTRGGYEVFGHCSIDLGLGKHSIRRQSYLQSVKS